MGDDQKWIREATELAVARFGCRPFSKTLFHVPTGGSHDQETFNHERFETKCAGKPQSECFSRLWRPLSYGTFISLAVCETG